MYSGQTTGEWDRQQPLFMPPSPEWRHTYASLTTNFLLKREIPIIWPAESVAIFEKCWNTRQEKHYNNFFPVRVPREQAMEIDEVNFVEKYSICLMVIMAWCIVNNAAMASSTAITIATSTSFSVLNANGLEPWIWECTMSWHLLISGKKSISCKVIDPGLSNMRGVTMIIHHIHIWWYRLEGIFCVYACFYIPT